MAPRASQRLRYRGHLYVQALEAPKPTAPLTVPTGEDTPADDPFADKTEELQKTPEEAVSEHIRSVVGGVIANAADLMTKARIQTPTADPQIVGVDRAAPKMIGLTYDLAIGNLKGKKARLFFTYMVTGVNQGGAPASFWESLKDAAQAVGGDVLKAIVGRSDFKLQNVVFANCGVNHGAKTSGSIPNVPKLLEAVGVVQDPRTTKHLQGRPAGKPLRGATETQLLKEIVDHVNAAAREDETLKPDWTSKDYVKKLVKSMNAGKSRLISDKALAAINEFIDKIPNFGEFMTALVQEGVGDAAKIAGIGADPEAINKKLAAVINRGQYTINYTAWKDVAITANDDGSKVYVELAAPMLPLFVFNTGGAQPQLESVNIQLCKADGTFIEAKGDKNISKLVWSGVVLSLAKKAAVNPPKLPMFKNREQFLTDAAKRAVEEAARTAPQEEKKPPEEQGGGPVPEATIMPKQPR